MREYKKLWLLLATVLVVTFGILGWSGVEIYKQVPPIPAQVVTESGRQIMTEEQILDGQTAWQSTGGMQVGSIWGRCLPGAGLDRRLAAPRAAGLAGSGRTGLGGSTLRTAGPA